MSAIDRIEEFNKFGSILGLERMSVLMELLGNPQEALKCIHVAGTNGKAHAADIYMKPFWQTDTGQGFTPHRL